MHLLRFTREAESMENAIRSAIADVSRAAPSLHVVRVEPVDLVLTGEAAIQPDGVGRLAAINAALELRRRVPEFADALELLRSPGLYGTASGAAPALGKGAPPSL